MERASKIANTRAAGSRFTDIIQEKETQMKKREQELKVQEDELRRRADRAMRMKMARPASFASRPVLASSLNGTGQSRITLSLQ